MRILIFIAINFTCLMLAAQISTITPFIGESLENGTDSGLLIIEANQIEDSVREISLLNYGKINSTHFFQNGDSIAYYNAVTAFKALLKIDSLNYQTHYFLGKMYYQKAISLVMPLDYDVDLSQLLLVQNNFVVILETALIHLEIANELKPDNTAILENLSGIYFSLNNTDMKNKIDSQLSSKGK